MDRPILAGDMPSPRDQRPKSRRREARGDDSLIPLDQPLWRTDPVGLFFDNTW